MTTRLNDRLRRAIVNTVLADVPQTNYGEMIDGAADAVAYQLMPAALQRALEVNSTEILPFLNHATVWISGTNRHAHCISPESGFNFTTLLGADPVIRELCAKADKQDAMLEELREKLRATVGAYSTVEALVKNVPEFAKYLPESIKPAAAPPAITNLMTDLLKAGWPKGGFGA